jgi:hypothetical protein
MFHIQDTTTHKQPYWFSHNSVANGEKKERMMIWNDLTNLEEDIKKCLSRFIFHFGSLICPSLMSKDGWIEHD